VQGHALGRGCEITMFCDITIAADNALFGEPEVRFSDVGPAIVMPWLVGYKKARELLYLGDMIDAEEAQRLGMVNSIVPLAELPAATLKFARRLALISPEALYASKLAISRGADVAGFRNAMQAGLDMVAPLYAAKSEVGLAFTDMTRKHGLRAALKWRRDQFDAIEREE
jgi:enoyl-CoA hydratase